MKAFKAPVDDIFFCLNHVAGVQQLSDWDDELAAQVVEVYAKVAEQELAPLNSVGDEQGCRIVDGRVLMPEGFKEVYQRYAADGWQGVCLPEEYGGQGMSSTLNSVLSEIFSGANHSLQMVLGLVPGASSVFQHFGSEQQKAKYLPLLASGEWIATMCLTEPGAGSDLGAIRTKATENGAGWSIDGEKIFISGGDQDMSEGILHLVLARTADGGTRGLSLFACPSHLEDGTRNTVSVERIEEKMGLHASPTCQMRFNGAQAEIIGQPGDGLKGMFAMMNHARLDVALQGVAHAARAYDIAASYAAERVQGRDANGQPTTIDQLPIVRHMLDDIAMLSLGGRAMAFKIMVLHESGEHEALVNFLTSVAKVFCSEAGIQAASLAQDVLGGYGYLTEYYADQTYRDARITGIYEGANSVHAMTLLTRQLGRGEGAKAFVALLEQMSADTSNDTLANAAATWRDMADKLVARQLPATCAKDFMDLTANVMLLAVWAVMLQRAQQAPDSALYERVGQRVMKRLPAKISYLASLIDAAF